MKIRFIDYVILLSDMQLEAFTPYKIKSNVDVTTETVDLIDDLPDHLRHVALNAVSSLPPIPDHLFMPYVNEIYTELYQKTIKLYAQYGNGRLCDLFYQSIENNQTLFNAYYDGMDSNNVYIIDVVTTNFLKKLFFSLKRGNKINMTKIEDFEVVELKKWFLSHNGLIESAWIQGLVFCKKSGLPVNSSTN